MPERPTFLTRLAIAQMAGLLIGLAGFEAITLLTDSGDPYFRWGVLLWYPTMAAMIAMLEELSGPDMPPWWVRGALVGGWFNAVITLLSFDHMAGFMAEVFGTGSLLSSPLWFVPEGIVAGILIGYLVMRFGGEGRSIEDD